MVEFMRKMPGKDLINLELKFCLKYQTYRNIKHVGQNSKRNVTDIMDFF